MLSVFAPAPGLGSAAEQLRWPDGYAGVLLAPSWAASYSGSVCETDRASGGWGVPRAHDGVHGGDGVSAGPASSSGSGDRAEQTRLPPSLNARAVVAKEGERRLPPMSNSRLIN